MNSIFEIKRWKRRNWAVYVDGTLLCVTVYKKRAKAVTEALEGRTA
jgi:hypothetical protein